MESPSLLHPAAALSPHPPFSTAAAALRLLLTCVQRYSEVCLSALLCLPSTLLLPTIICGGEICLFRPWLVNARAGIKEIHFLPFNHVVKRNALTYIDLADGNWYRKSKEAPEQILSLCNAKEYLKKKVHGVIDKYIRLHDRSAIVTHFCLQDMKMDKASEEAAVTLAAQGMIGKRVDEMEPGFLWLWIT